MIAKILHAHCGLEHQVERQQYSLVFSFENRTKKSRGPFATGFKSKFEKIIMPEHHHVIVLVEQKARLWGHTKISFKIDFHITS